MKNGRKNTTVDYPRFSVAMSVYGKDRPEWFYMALNSIIDQTVKPDEIVLVVDGPIPGNLQDVVEKCSGICKEEGVLLKVMYLSENRGLGYALKVAVRNCSNDIIARMDSDDIAMKERFEYQIKMLIKDEELAVCGGQIEEFIDYPSNVVGKRIVPKTDKELKEYIKKRCPFNHVTVMYRKSAVLEAGNYQEWFWNEDYYLWIRMALKNQKFANVPQILVKVRVGKDMYARRGGDKYFKSEIKLQKYMLKNGLIHYPTYVDNCVKRFIIQKVLPNNVRAWVYKEFARK